MTEINQSLKEFIKKLRSIDVPELLEKAKSINIEDIRSIKWSDIQKIKDSYFFYPTLGTISAGILTVLVLMPSFKSVTNIRNKSIIYRQEANELQNLKERVAESSQINDNLNKEIKLLASSILSRNQLINITRILDEVSKQNSAVITEFLPITQEEIQQCSSSSQSELRMNPQSRNRDFNNKGLMGQDTQKRSFSPSSNNLPEGNFLKQKVFTDMKLRSARKLNNLFISNSVSLSNRFNSNYYLLKLNTKYINAINFLKGLQEFKSDLIPLCFQTSPLNSNQNVRSKSMDIRVYLNVPTQ